MKTEKKRKKDGAGGESGDCALSQSETAGRAQSSSAGPALPGKKNGKRMAVLPGIFLLAGLGLLCYPAFSSWWNAGTQSRAVATYDAAVSVLPEKDFSEFFEAAQAYNEAVCRMGSARTLTNPACLEEYAYEDLLNITGTGVMGYVTIDKISTELPIYHGTSGSVLSAGAGHLEGSSLPIGGESTHSVISAHTGLPSALLFTRLDQLEIGDTFEITVLNERSVYEVDRISVVEPTEFENLYIEDGEDCCTLMTCTPYGINTHRLLVRGRRTESTVEDTAEDDRRPLWDAGKFRLIAAALSAVLLLSGILLFWRWAAGRRKTR